MLVRFFNLILFKLKSNKAIFVLCNRTRGAGGLCQAGLDKSARSGKAGQPVSLMHDAV